MKNALKKYLVKEMVSTKTEFVKEYGLGTCSINLKFVPDIVCDDIIKCIYGTELNKKIIETKLSQVDGDTVNNHKMDIDFRELYLTEKSFINNATDLFVPVELKLNGLNESIFLDVIRIIYGVLSVYGINVEELGFLAFTSLYEYRNKNTSESIDNKLATILKEIRDTEEDEEDECNCDGNCDECCQEPDTQKKEGTVNRKTNTDISALLTKVVSELCSNERQVKSEKPVEKNNDVLINEDLESALKKMFPNATVISML